MYNKQTKVVFYKLFSIILYFSEVVSYLPNSLQNAKNKMLYKIRTAKWYQTR